MEDQLFSVADQVVLVAGASRGIGRALAEGFAARGAQVVVSGREQATLEVTAREISHGDKPVRAIVGDIAVPADNERLAEAVVNEFGRIDTLINVAGVNVRRRVETYELKEYDHIFNINLRGVFHLSQVVGRHMIARKRGAIINIDSLNTYAPLKGVTPYAMSKAGVLMMTRGMASEWGPHGVRVNSIAPGFFPTELAKKVWADPKMQAWGKTNTPLGRLGEVEELVGAAIFLASDASKYITGQTIRVDGGITAGVAWPIELP